VFAGQIGLSRSMQMVRVDHTNAERSKRARARQREGLVVFSFEGDEVEVPEILIEAGFLDPGQTENRKAISQALSRWFDVIKKEKGS
jgi:hypothetical protein